MAFIIVPEIGVAEAGGRLQLPAGQYKLLLR